MKTIAVSKRLLILPALVAMLSVASISSGLSIGNIGSIADKIIGGIIIKPSQILPLPASTMDTVRQLLLNYVNQRQVAAPSGVFCSTCLFKSWKRRIGGGNGRRFAIGDLQAAMMDYPVQVRDRLKVLLYSASGSTSFENFSLNIQHSHALKRSYLGVARRVNGIVDVAIVSADLSAELVPKTITLKKKVCKKIWWVKKCKTKTFVEPRGYYASEINAMMATLQSETFKLFKEFTMKLTV